MIKDYLTTGVKTGLIVGAVFLIPLIIRMLSNNSKAADIIRLTEKGERFVISRALRFFVMIGTIAFVVFFVGGYYMVSQREFEDIIVFGFIASIFGFIGFMATLEGFRGYIFVDCKGVEYRKIWKVKKFDGEDIVSVSMCNGFLFIDFKSGKSKRIYMSFGDRDHLIGLINEFVIKNRNSASQG